MKHYLLMFATMVALTVYYYRDNKQAIKTDKAPVPTSPYSQGIESNGFVFVAGQIGLNPATRTLVSGGLEAEVPQIMSNIEGVLEKLGSDVNHIVNATVFMRNLQDFKKMNELYGKYFSPLHFPARTTVQVDSLPGGAAIEIAVIAVKKK